MDLRRRREVGLSIHHADAVSAGKGSWMRNRSLGCGGLLAAAAIAVYCLTVVGCSSLGLSFAGEDDSRPGRILIYDITATAAELPADAAIREHYSGERAMSDEELEVARQLGAAIAHEIASQIRALGLPAVRASGQGLLLRDGDLVVEGEFVELNSNGSSRKIRLGFGSRTRDLRTHIEVHLITGHGPVPLGENRVETAAGSMPGVLLALGSAPIGGGNRPLNSQKGATTRAVANDGIDAAVNAAVGEFMAIATPAMVRRGWIDDPTDE
jgi:hypothetical protein